VIEFTSNLYMMKIWFQHWKNPFYDIQKPSRNKETVVIVNPPAKFMSTVLKHFGFLKKCGHTCIP